MVFNSLEFFLFFPAASLLYFLVPGKHQWKFLLFVSAFFYLFASLKFGVFLIGTTATVYLAAIELGRIGQDRDSALRQAPSKEQAESIKGRCRRRKKRILAAALIFNFGILAFLKYFNFFSEGLNGFFSVVRLPLSVPELRLLLPLGISFYTFQAVGYLIDVYRGRYPPERNIARLGLFLSFFPQIMEGPIARYDDLAPQLFTPHEFDYDGAKFGAQLMLWGYFKKVVIADRAGILVNAVYATYTRYTGPQIAAAAVVYAVQIYADFSGYIDIATGAAQFMGIRLAKNFDRPYFSKSVAEFWRRWLITLGAWFRDYLFYPVALSKAAQKMGRFGRKHLSGGFAKNIPTFLGLAVVWVTTGLWHGAAWHYVLYGVYYGTLIILSVLFRPLSDRMNRALRIRTDGTLWKLFRVARTFALVCIGFVLFRADDMAVALSMLQSVFLMKRPASHNSLLQGNFSRTDLVFLILGVGVLLLVSALRRKHSLRKELASRSAAVRWTVYCTAALAVVFMGVFLSSDPIQFIYFQF